MMETREELIFALETKSKVISELRQMMLKYRHKLKATNKSVLDLTQVLVNIQDIIIGTDVVITSDDAVKLIDNILIEYCPYLVQRGIDEKKKINE